MGFPPLAAGGESQGINGLYRFTPGQTISLCIGAVGVTTTGTGGYAPGAGGAGGTNGSAGNFGSGGAGGGGWYVGNGIDPSAPGNDNTPNNSGGGGGKANAINPNGGGGQGGASYVSPQAPNPGYTLSTHSRVYSSVGDGCVVITYYKPAP